MANGNTSLAKNSIFNVAYQVLNIAFPLITSAYTARILMPSGIGLVAYAQNIAQYFVIIAALGIPNYGIREVARVKSSTKDLNLLFSELFSLNFFSTALSALVYYSAIFLLPAFEAERPLFCATGIIIILNICNVDWFYQGEEEYQYITTRSFVVKLVSLVLMFVLVRTSSDYVAYALITCAATAGNYLLNMLNLRRFSIRPAFKRHNLKKHLKPIGLLFATTVAIEIYTLMDTTMIGVLCANENVAFYTYASRIAKMAITVICAFGAVLLPRLSLYRSQGDLEGCSQTVNQVLGILLMLLIPCGIGMYMASDCLVLTLFGEDYLAASLTLKILSFLFYTLGLSNLFGTQILVTFEGEKQLLAATCAGAIFNLIANAFLIPAWQENGAAVASVISELIVTAMTYTWAKKKLAFGIGRRELFKLLIAACGMGIVLYALNYLQAPAHIMLILNIAIGGLVYAVLCRLMKADSLTTITNSIKALLGK